MKIPRDYDIENEIFDRKHDAWLDREYEKYCQKQWDEHCRQMEEHHGPYEANRTKESQQPAQQQETKDDQ